MCDAIPIIIQLDSRVPAGQLALGLPSARIIRFDDGELLPPISSMSALVVLGGRQNAYDPSLEPVRQLLREATAAELPTLGICLGAQLLATSHGGAVEVDAPAGPERGIITIKARPGAESDPLFGAAVSNFGRDLQVVSMHSDAVTDLPAGATWLAASQQYPYQAFRIGSALGVQFHPEADAVAFGEWMSRETGADPEQVHAQWNDCADDLVALARHLAAQLTALADSYSAMARA